MEPNYEVDVRVYDNDIDNYYDGEDEDSLRDYVATVRQRRQLPVCAMLHGLTLVDL